MHIKSIELSNVRGVRHLRADELPETGVIVIHGGNEAGKSTVLEALKIVLTQPHNSSAQRSRGTFAHHGAGWLAPVDVDEAPEITLQMAVGDYEFKIFKRFKKSKAAELTIYKPRRESYTGAQAEARLEEILEEAVEMNLLDSLFMHQGEEDAALQAAGLKTLEQALQHATGLDSDSAEEDDSELGARVQAEYLRYFTKSRQTPTKEYAEAIGRVEDAEEALADAQDAVNNLQSRIDEVERAQKTLSDAKARIPEAEEDLATKTTAAQAAAEVQKKLEVAQLDYQRAKEDLDRAQQDLTRRDELDTELEKAQKLETKFATEHAQAEQSAKEEAQSVAAAKDKLAAARKARDTARLDVQEAKRQLGVAKDWEKRSSLQDKVAQLDKLHQVVVKKRAAAASRGPVVVTDAHVTEAEKAANELELAQHKRDTAAAKLLLTATEPTAVGVDGQEITVLADAETTVALADGTTIEIGNVTAQFVQAAGIKVDWNEKVDSAQQVFDSLMDQLGTKDLEDVRSRRDNHRAVEEELTRAQAELRSALGGEDLEELRAVLQALDEKFAADSGDCAQVSVEDATTALAAAEEELSAADAAFDRAQISVEALSDNQAQLKRAEVAQKLRGAEDAVARARELINRADAEASREALAQAVEDAREAYQEHKSAVAERQAEVKAANPEVASKLRDGAAAALKSIQETIQDAERKLLSNQSYIDQAEGAEEELAIAENELEAAENQLHNVTRRAEAVAYLAEVLDRHRTAAREKYAAPFAAKLSQFAQVVFGSDVSFNLNEHLEVESRTRAGATVELGDLSGGAKEQLSLLTRFAIASLVADPDGTKAAGGTAESVPIVIDDALGSTDSYRLDLMATLFHDVGKASQVIVLTCMPERYERIPGRVSLDIETLKS
ncbi:hypothetical protein CPHO_07685 [Corynebacterium phocae]|uniref:Rad50/SbcC-type AAA domain-containing protein n=1 Tax=Corynebacterium phocae TaxID=161895 RepID=A0A1L7D3V6_9CORY|nr:AAA family ATPase [Corynebacterium phocae]APT92790.1 hypothetical protein CPHO_07685 [Corynebacterium phocae]